MGYLADIQVEEGFWSNRYPGLSWVKADIQVRRDAEGLIRHAEKFAKDCDYFQWWVRSWDKMEKIYQRV